MAVYRHCDRGLFKAACVECLSSNSDLPVLIEVKAARYSLQRAHDKLEAALLWRFDLAHSGCVAADAEQPGSRPPFASQKNDELPEDGWSEAVLVVSD
jgi:hypothetical protein